MARALLAITKESKSKYQPLYSLDESVKSKLGKIAELLYGAEGVEYSEQAENYIEFLEKNELANLPICVAKTQFSLSDDPKLYGRPRGFKIKIRELKVSAGAGFIVAYAGDIMTMPGLPKHPAAENMDISEEGRIRGLF